MAEEGKDLTKLATWAANLRLEEVPPAVRDRAQLALLDLTGASLAGSRDPGMAEMARALAVRTGPATLIGTPWQADPAAAALFNGTATVALELDEGNQFAKAHPGAHVWPAVLAAAEEADVSGARALEAFIAGYEVATRVGVATALRSTVHPHGTAVSVGAAAGLARLWGFSPAQLAAAVQQAAALTVPADWDAALAGATLRNLFTGVTMQNAFVAAGSVRWGFTHNPATLANVFGQILGSSFDPARLAEGLGETWYVARGYFKVHACCQYNHSTLDAIADLRRRNPFSAQEVEAVRVETYALATRLRNPEPASTLGAKFSIPFATAAAIVLGETGPEAFGAANLHNPAIRALAHRVAVSEDPAFTAELPGARPSRVIVTLTGGRVLVAECHQSRGLADQPFTHAELVAKYRRLADPVLGAAAAPAMDAVFRLAALPQIRTLTGYLRKDV